MRPARPADQPDIDRFLRDRLDSSMFLLGNLRRYGPCGGTAPRAMRFWIAGDMAGVVALSTEGIVMPQLPDGAGPDLARILRGAKLRGFIGAGDQVEAARRACGLIAAPTNLDAQERLFARPLRGFGHDAAPGMTLAPLAAWRDTALAWRMAYHAEVLGTPADRIAPTARADIESCLETDSHRILLQDGRPVAMTGFNMMLPEAVQVGGVYTPPELRGRHLARTALGLHLAEAARQHPRAILFAKSDQAIRAYRALGFRETGRFALVLFAMPESVR
ncbi:MAG: putative acetyltransferase [Rhodobacteraceae bacterium HLUCCA08]|nr:MAG: putative acetyltransferase [Rhodobacteraceae bacterium HLUCCA08]